MTRNWSSGAERLANVARAAGFAMATPDDLPEDVSEKPPAEPAKTVTGWKSVSPGKELVVASPRQAGLPTLFRDWMASLNWRAPA